MSWKKGGFIFKRHNDLRDPTANMMPEVCKDTEIEPKIKHHYLEKNCKIERQTIQRTQGQISRLEVSGNEGCRHLTTYGFSTPTHVVIATSSCRVLCYEWTGKETSLQWKNPSNRPWYIYTYGVFNQGQYRKRVPKALIAFGTNKSKESLSVIDFR